MKRIKDFFYNKNDIIIVLIILAVAAFIIYTRIDSIMEYPEKLAKQAAATEEQTSENATEAASEREMITVTIEDSDTASSVSKKIFDAGLVASANDFEEYMISMEKQDSIKTGTFQIPISSLQEEILNIITN